METDANKTEENNVKKTEEDNAVPKITSVIKPKMKDPRRVAQGKNSLQFPGKRKNVKQKNVKPNAKLLFVKKNRTEKIPMRRILCLR